MHCAGEDSAAEGSALLPRKGFVWQEPVDDRCYLTLIEWLDYILSCSKITRNFARVKIIHARDDNHRLGLQPGKVLDMIEEIEAVHIRHPYVEKDQIGFKDFQRFERIGPTHRLFDIIPVPLKNCCHRLQPHRFIVDDQDVFLV
jgi:hypothetical protein